MEIKAIAHMKSDYKTKFGIPRQAGLVQDLKSTIVFEPEFRDPDMIRGLEGFSRIWVIWEFSENTEQGWSATVRPPRLGGNERKGVFATRSTYRPNSLGMSCLEIESIDWDTNEGPKINVLGADLLDNTPIYDIKPYMPYSDSFPDAKTDWVPKKDPELEVVLPDKFDFPENKLNALKKILSLDPRPAYQKDEERVYGFEFDDYKIKFKVTKETVIVTEILMK